MEPKDTAFERAVFGCVSPPKECILWTLSSGKVSGIEKALNSVEENLESRLLDCAH